MSATLGLTKKYEVEMPIVFAVGAVVNHGADTWENVDNLMSRKRYPKYSCGLCQ